MSNKFRHRLKDNFGCIHRLDLDSYDDRVDVSPEISLFEYGILRQRRTGKTLFWHENWDSKKNKIEQTGYIVVKYISEKDVKDAIACAKEDIFDFMGSSKYELLEELATHPNLVAHIIRYFNSWNGYFIT